MEFFLYPGKITMAMSNIRNYENTLHIFETVKISDI